MSSKIWLLMLAMLACIGEDDENFDQTLELQLGKMLSPKWGFYGEILVGDEVLDSNAYNLGVGVGVRMMY